LKKALVIGGGIAGCSSAYFLNKKNFKVDLIDTAPSIGAGNKTAWFGGHPHTFGPRHIITKNEEVYSFLDDIFPLRAIKNYQLLNFQHEENNFFHFPPNKSDLKKFKSSEKIEEEIKFLESKDINYSELGNFEEYWRLALGDTLYEKFVGPYSSKMWPDIKNTEIDDYGWSPKGAPLRDKSYNVYPEEEGWMVAYPDSHHGYDHYFDFFTESINIFTSTKIEKFDLLRKRFFFNGSWKQYDIVVNSISPDTLFDNCYGNLPFVGRDIEFIVLPIKHLFPKDIYMLYFPGPENFTRIVEYKNFTNFHSNSTLIGIEKPSPDGKHYPLPIKKFQKIAEKYRAEMPDGYFNVGRAGSYDYKIDIDDSVLQAMDLSLKL